MIRPDSRKPAPPAKRRSASPAEPEVSAAGGWLARLRRLRLRIWRQGLRFELRLEDPQQTLDAVRQTAAAASRSEAEAIRASLKAVLDRHAESREVLLHARVLEKALRSRGLGVIDELPDKVLERALFQLDALVGDWARAGLSGLRQRLQDALAKHARANDKRSTAERLSDFEAGGRVQVNEASESTFQEATAEWERSWTSRQRRDTEPR